MDGGTLNRETMVIIDGLDPNWRFQELSNALSVASKDCLGAGSNSEDPIVWLPFEKTAEGELELKGFAYLYFDKKEESEQFVKNWRMHKALQNFVRRHVQVYSWSHIQMIQDTPDEYTPLGKKEFSQQRNLYYWLTDPDGNNGFREQYVIRYLSDKWHETFVNWFDERIPKTHSVASYDGSREHLKQQTLTVSWVKWSNHGGYLASFARKGIQVWGGPEWTELERKMHGMVDYIDFSPHDTCLVTLNSKPTGGGEDNQPKLTVWDMTHGRAVSERTFNMKDIGISLSLKLGGEDAWWPMVKWGGPKDSYFGFKTTSSKSARYDKMTAKDLNQITIFDGETFVKLGKKSIPVPDLYDFGLSPTEHLLAYTTKTRGKNTASLVIMSLPSKEVVKTQTLGYAKQCSIYWQSQGEFIAVKMVNKDHSTRVGILSVKEEGMPWNLSEELPFLDYLAWEPNGSRFAVLQFDDRRYHDLPSVSIFDIANRKTAQCKRLVRFSTVDTDRIKANNIHWAPQGGRLVVSYLKRSQTGQIIFIDLTTGKCVKRLHEDANYIAWDPSGRYLCTAATQPIESKAAGDETGFIIWSFQGEQLHKEQLSRFYQFLWRPRPTMNYLDMSLPTVDELKPRMKAYAELFEKSDVDVKRQHQSKHIQVNLTKLRKWEKKQAELDQRTQELRKKMSRKYGSDRIFKDDSEYEIKEVTQEVQESYEDAVINEYVVSRILSGDMVNIDSLPELMKQAAALQPGMRQSPPRPGSAEMGRGQGRPMAMARGARPAGPPRPGAVAAPASASRAPVRAAGRGWGPRR